ncbi:MAG TPA: RNA 2',3'-cyclic phosphodiesterase [Acidobacteriota bacterium]|nr:RNA 2',3'-cyclic phosphodiesterase [Acidobacteriota bacterium]HNT17541.1 RNA 2',3'-cyclic phosphodiesterase [Acidobacteriota bacterium]HPA26863.1 RNA 2',3'-cyclic phosphodiesterase [Acidobacteriota bacterium]HQO19861.1 RNA 2',3'-cyclic phosphodiesterase [Acidobacteriota bacterium]HQQ47276.1 RNA 2',3'-cyclic phosphodiesterase [Acidobacteriota bacterium]
MRAFVAIETGEEIRKVLSSLLGRLAPAGGGISWVRPEQMHLTLHFFEELPEGDLEKISDALGLAASSTKPFTLEIKDTGSFGPAGSPRVFWCGVGGDLHALRELQAKIEKNLEEAGFRGDGKAFKPHLTLGRNKTGSRQDRVRTLLEGLRDYSVGSFRVEGVTLFRSELRKEGALHTPLEHFALEERP